MAATPEARIIDAMAQVIEAVDGVEEVVQLATQPDRPDPKTVYLITQGSTSDFDSQRVGNTYGDNSSGYELWVMTMDVLTLARRDPCKLPRSWRRAKRDGPFPDAAVSLEADPFSTASEGQSLAWTIEGALREPWYCSPAFEDQDDETDAQKAENARIRYWLRLSVNDAMAVRVQWSNTEKDRIVVLNQTWQIIYQRFSPKQEANAPLLK